MTRKRRKKGGGLLGEGKNSYNGSMNKMKRKKMRKRMVKKKVILGRNNMFEERVRRAGGKVSCWEGITSLRKQDKK